MVQRPGNRRRRLAATAAVVTVLLGVAACTAGNDPVDTRNGAGTAGGPPATGSVPSPSAPTSTAKPEGLPDAPALGLKWNWGQKATLDFLKAEPPGPTFYEVEWCAMEPTKGQIEWGQVDQIVKRAELLSSSLMLKIRVGAGCWGAQGGGEAVRDPQENTRKTPSEFPTDPAAYTAFVTAFVQRYSAMGVHTYAIENEVDANNFWSGTPQEYVELLSLGAKAVRAADPSAHVLDAGISSTGYGVAMAGDLLDAGKDDEALKLYQAYYARRLQGDASRFPAIDSVAALRELMKDERVTRVRAMVAATWKAIGSGDVTAYQLHFYEGAELAPVLLDYIRDHIGETLPIEGWEVGLAWPGSDFTLAKQSSEVAQLLTVLYSRGVSPLVYLPLAFTPGPGKKEVFRGLIAPDGSAYPAASAFQRMGDVVKNSASVRPIRATGWKGAVFRDAGQTKAVVWRTSGTAALALADGQELIDLTGRALASGTPVSTDPVVLTLPLTDDTDLGSALTAALGTSTTVE